VSFQDGILRLRMRRLPRRHHDQRNPH
jgi:hypothetical protein